MIDRQHQLLIGSYTDLGVLAHWPDARTTGAGLYMVTLTGEGSLEIDGVVGAENPAAIVGYGDSRTYFTVAETIAGSGSVSRYQTDSDGSLEHCETIVTAGRSTCDLAVAPRGDAAVIVNYWDSVIEVVELGPDGRLGPTGQTLTQHGRPPGSWRQVVDAADHMEHRQAGPHPHSAYFWQDWVFIPDLGDDAVFQYRWNTENRRLLAETTIGFEPGTGPRQMAVHPELDVCYISGELSSTITAARLDRSQRPQVVERIAPFQRLPTSPDRSNSVSALVLSPDARFLLVGNRGDDSLFTFAVGEDGSLEPVGSTKTNGRTPRHFAITPCGRGVVVANQDSSSLQVLSRDVETGTMEVTTEPLSIPAPNFVLIR